MGTPIGFETSFYTPVNKTRVSQSATTAVGFWTASGVAKPVITDYQVSMAAAATFQIKFGYATASGFIQSSVVAEGLGSSAMVYPSLNTPLVGDTNGGTWYFETGANGYAVISAQGFEVE